MEFFRDEEGNVRCVKYLNMERCSSGDYCRGIHKYPYEDRIACRYWKYAGTCPYNERCWFFHNEETNNARRMNNNRLDEQDATLSTAAAFRLFYNRAQEKLAKQPKSDIEVIVGRRRN